VLESRWLALDVSACRSTDPSICRCVPAAKASDRLHANTLHTHEHMRHTIASSATETCGSATHATATALYVLAKESDITRRFFGPSLPSWRLGVLTHHTLPLCLVEGLCCKALSIRSSSAR
jgi:hypothetical protein